MKRYIFVSLLLSLAVYAMEEESKPIDEEMAELGYEQEIVEEKKLTFHELAQRLALGNEVVEKCLCEELKKIAPESELYKELCQSSVKKRAQNNEVIEPLVALLTAALQTQHSQKQTQKRWTVVTAIGGIATTVIGAAATAGFTYLVTYFSAECENS